MTDYQKMILDKLKRQAEAQAKAQNPGPDIEAPDSVVTDSGLDIDMVREIEDPVEAVSDDEYADVFNDENGVKDHDTDEIEIEEEDDETPADKKRRKNEDKDKKKRSSESVVTEAPITEGEIESLSIADVIVSADTWDIPSDVPNNVLDENEDIQTTVNDSYSVPSFDTFDEMMSAGNEERLSVDNLIQEENISVPEFTYVSDETTYAEMAAFAGENAVQTLKETEFESDRVYDETSFIDRFLNKEIPSVDNDSPIIVTDQLIPESIAPEERSDMAVDVALSSLSNNMVDLQERMMEEVQTYANEHNIPYEDAHIFMKSSPEFTEYQRHLDELDAIKTMSHAIEERGFVLSSEAEFASGYSMEKQGESVIDVTADAVKQISDKASEIGEVEKEAKEQASEYKEEELHSFSAALQGFTGHLEQGGQQLVNMVTDEIETADKNTAAGFQTMKNIAEPIIDVIAMAGYSAVASDLGDKINQLKIGGQAFDAAVKAGFIDVTTFADLSSSEIASLKDTLKIAGYSKEEIKAIFCNKDIFAGLGSGADASMAMNGVRGEILGSLQAEKQNLQRERSVLDSKRSEMDPLDYKDACKRLEGQIQKNAENIERISSNNFFNVRDKENIPLVQQYFNTHPDDFVRNALGNGKFSRMSTKDLQKFIRELEKHGDKAASTAAQAVSTYGKLLKQYQNAEQNKSRNVHGLASKTLRRMVKNVTEGDANTSAGLNELQRGVHIAKASAKGITYGARFGKRLLIGTKRGGYHGLLTNGWLIGTKNHKINLPAVKKILIGTRLGGYRGLLSFTMAGIVSLKTQSLVSTDMLARMIADKKNAIKAKLIGGKNKIKKKVRKAANKVTTPIRNSGAGRAANKAVSRQKELLKKMRDKQKKHAQKKAMRRAAIRASKPVQFGLTITKPFRAARKLLGDISKFFSKAKLILLVTIAALVLLYMAVVLSMQAILQQFAAMVDTNATTVDTKSDDFMKDTVNELLTKFNDRTQSAIDYGTGVPQNPSVWGSHTIDKYGHPSTLSTISDTGQEVTTTVTQEPCQTNEAHEHMVTSNWISGYTIHYVDGDGRELVNIQNNVKDAILLAYVELNGASNDEENFTKVINEWFSYLTPEIDPATDIIESDIYACEGCETVHYKCNDSATLAANMMYSYVSQSDIQSDIDNGAHFYSNIVSNTGDKCGDYFIATCNGCKHEKTTYDHCMDGQFNEDGSPKKCPGHTTTVTEDHGYAINKIPDSCSNYTIEWFCTGHETKACYGHKDVDIYLTVRNWQEVIGADTRTEEMRTSKEAAYYPDGYMLEGNFDGLYCGDYQPSYLKVSGRKSYEWNNYDESWIQSLYDADWNALYGIDPSMCSGIMIGSTLTQEEIDAILANLPADVNERQQMVVSVALDMQGKISYYYGGKPSSYGYPVQTKVGPANYAAKYPDHIGRTIAGLDCFGFVEYVYWRANYLMTGDTSDIFPEGYLASTSDVYNSGGQYGNLIQIPQNQLQPGDLGFEDGHVGIYIGTFDGKMKWVHCTGGNTSNVVFNDYGGFTKFYRFIGWQ